MGTSPDSTKPSSPQQKFSAADADRLLGLADQFLEDWEQNEGKDDPDCIKRRAEWDAIRPLFASSPDILKALERCKRAMNEISENFSANSAFCQALDNAFQVIDKATGGASC